MNVYLAEFIGTAILIYLGCGVNAGTSLKESYSNASGWVVICMGWGLAVTLAIYAVGPISGAHINPAVTISLALAGDFSWSLVPGYVMAQLLGGIAGGTLVWMHYLPHWGRTEDETTKLGVFSTSPAIPSLLPNLLTETMGTFTLVFALMFLGATEFSQGLNPIVVGGLIVAIGMSLGGTSGYAINPARDLGPRIAHFILPIQGKGKSNWGYAWVPVFGPILGGASGALLYRALFNQQYSFAFFGCITLLVILIVSSAIMQKRQDQGV